MKANVFILTAVLFLSGCVGSPIHSSIKYDQVQNQIKKNNANLTLLSAGMTKEKVLEVMGKPERSEGYPWGSAWLYRTSMSMGVEGSIYGQVDADYTPVMFDKNDDLQGWGRNYYEQFTTKYELTIK